MTPGRARTVAFVLLGVALPLSFWFGALQPSQEGTIELAAPLEESVPLELAGWTASETQVPLTDAEIRTIRADDWLKRVYHGPDGEAVVLFVLFHGNKERGLHRYYHNATVCYPAAGYEQVVTRPGNVVLKDLAEQVPVCRYTFARAGSRVSVLTFFKINDELLDQSPRNKPFWMIMEKLTPEFDDSPGHFSQVQIIAPVDGDDDYAAERAQGRFLEDFGRTIFAALEVRGAAGP